MTYYHASTSNSGGEAFGGDCEVYELEYDENYVADGKCRCKEGTSCNIQIVRRN